MLADSFQVQVYCTSAFKRLLMLHPSGFNRNGARGVRNLLDKLVVNPLSAQIFSDREKCRQMTYGLTIIWHWTLSPVITLIVRRLSMSGFKMKLDQTFLLANETRLSPSHTQLRIGAFEPMSHVAGPGIRAVSG